MISPQSSILVPGLLTEHPGMSCYRTFEFCRCQAYTAHDPVDYVPLFAGRERMRPEAVGEVVSYEGLVTHHSPVLLPKKQTENNVPSLRLWLTEYIYKFVRKFLLVYLLVGKFSFPKDDLTTITKYQETNKQQQNIIKLSSQRRI